MSETDEQVTSLLAELRSLLALEDNDLVWSRWDSVNDALAEFDAVVASGNSNKLKYLLLPTASLQEVSLSSGWGEDFVRIANEIDAALDL